MNDDLEERQEMLRCFLTESWELLDDVEPEIIAMESTSLSSGDFDQETLNKIFRLFHSLKGSAACLNFNTISSVTHEAETLLDIFRQGTMVEPKHVDLLIRTCDLVRTILNTLEQQHSDQGFENEAEVIINDLQHAIASLTGNLTESEDDLNLDIAEMTGRFVEESLELLEEAEKSLLELEKAPGNLVFAGQAFRALHSFKGNAGFFGYADLEEVSHQAETLLDKIREGEKSCASVDISFLLIALDALRDGVQQISSGLTPQLPIKEDLINHLNNLSQMTDGVMNKKEQRQELNTLEESKEIEHLQINTPVEVTETECHPSDPKERQPVSGRQQVIRVDIERLDILLDLVGELVIAEAMVANNPDLQGHQLDRFEKAVLQLDKITRDIQEVAMSMRMIPLAGTFRKMVRLVRDLANNQNKKINLEIVGEETEVDKTIIEQIADPLVHLIRNAVDHGIENPEDRVAKGKPETGRLTLEAKHSAGEVWIIVEDDGKGLNRDVILRKGIERGLIKADNQELKDEEVWKLIFEPGFSTAEKVSNISGRGVGMDVVRRNIEKLRGKVDIRSKPGSGTILVLRIPLTLAIIEGMVVRVGQNRYTIPISSIKESLQPRPEQITITPDNLEIVRIRGELLPVVRLHEYYQVESMFHQLTDGILIVVENDDKKCCLFVDELIGQQQIVIKGLSGYLGHVRSISGCAILGDGDISMILDIADLINTVEKAKG